MWTTELQINNPLKDGWTTSTNRTATYKSADKSLARTGMKQANVSVRMAWISFNALPCRKIKKTWWQLASRCCWNRAHPWHASELVSFLDGLRTYQLPGICKGADTLAVVDKMVAGKVMLCMYAWMMCSCFIVGRNQNRRDERGSVAQNPTAVTTPFLLHTCK